MKQRNPFAVALLPLVTFGFYSLYWLMSTGDELRAKGNEIKPNWWLFAPLGLVVFGFGFAFLGVAADSEALKLLSILVPVTGYIAAICISLYWQYIYAKAVDNVTGGKMSTVVTLLLFFFLGSIGQAIIQDTYNHLGEGAPAPAPATPNEVPMAEAPSSTPTDTSAPTATPTPPATSTPPTDVTPDKAKDA